MRFTTFFIYHGILKLFLTLVSFVLMSGIESYFIYNFIRQIKCYGVLFLIGYITLGNAQVDPRKTALTALAELKANPNYSPKDTVQIDLLNKLAEELRYYNSDSLLLLANQALQHSKAAGYKRGESMSLLRIGDYYSDQGDKQQAIVHFQKALELAQHLPNPNLSLRIQNNLASEYVYSGDYAMALNGYLKGIELAEAKGNKTMQSIMNENIANLYASQKDYPQALEFYSKVKKLNEKLENPIHSAKTMANIASLYAEMGSTEYAMFNVNSCITTFEKHQILDWLAYAYEVKGKIYVNQEKYSWALQWYNQSAMLHKKINDDRGKIDLLNGMAMAYLGLKKDSIAEQHAKEALEIATRISFLEGIQKSSKALYQTSKNKEDYASALHYHEHFQKVSDTLSKRENSKSLSMLQTKIDYEKQRTGLIQENDKALAKQQNYINVGLAILLVFIAITLIIHRNEKIQKKLNKELSHKKEDLEKREAELYEINETKDKLFSIIGHDLRGPIGALQGLLKLFKDGEISKEEFLQFIPKLGDDVNHISFTLNNLLSWGQSQMKGAITRPSVIALENLFSENINLLSDIASSKSIAIINKLPENMLAWSDGNQMDIVIRNLLSNALKFTPNKGTITIGAEEKSGNWEVFVQDTGVGIDKAMQEQLFSRNANTSTYGTNKEKGTGLGLALCKEMIEKNAGAIWVVSVPKIGSCFYFTVPKGEEKYRKTA